MKKKLLFIAMLVSLYTQAQIAVESFEQETFPPPGWEIYQNEVGTNNIWRHNPLNNSNRPAHTGNRAAFLDRVNISGAVNPQDWLVTPPMTFGPENDAISFFSRLTATGDQGSTYRIMIKPVTVGPSGDFGSYVELQNWTELEINPVQEEYTQQIVPIPSVYYGSEVWIAFVMTSVNGGDRWLLDDVSMGTLNLCQPPFSLSTSNITSTSATLNWGVYNASQWEVEVISAAEAFTGNAVATVSVNSYTATGLAEGDYKFRVRALCDNGETSGWSQPFNFTTINANIITGTLRFDTNGDGDCENNNIIPFTQILVNINNTNSYSVYTNSQGIFTLQGLPLGSTTIELTPVLQANFPQAAPTVTEINFTTGESIAHIDICLPQPEIVNNTSVTLIPVGQARPGFYSSYKVTVKNNNIATITNAVATLTFDDARLDFNSAQIPGTNSGNTVTFNAGALNPFETRTYNITFYVLPPDTNIGGEMLVFDATVTQDQTDAYPEDNTVALNQVIVNSYDPNDITVHEGAHIREEQKNNFLTYTIRFQNTGTASAINIRLENVLDDKMDFNTFQPLISSHSYTAKRTGNLLEFMYENINLPDSTANEAASHGYITYRIKPKSTAAVGDVFLNSAGIYFDFNPAIVTNTVTTEIIENLGINENDMYSTILYPNPVKNKLYISINTGDTLQNISVYDNSGRLCHTTINPDSSIDLHALPAGLYFVKVTTQKGVFSHKVIKQ